MKRPLFKRACLSALIAMNMAFSYGQQVQNRASVPCYSDELMSEQLKKDPSIQNRANERDFLIRQFIKDKHKNEGSGTLKSLNANLIIPVVVYVVHEYGVENITDLQVTSQIDALNTYYAPYGIQFCLATKKGTQNLTSITTPSGITSSTPGIFHYGSSVLTNHNVSQQAALTAIGSTLPADQYLKIWVVKGITSSTLPPGEKILGYSMLPEFAAPATDGIVMSYDAFGDIASCSCSTLAAYSQHGKILVHEVGHYLGLYHTFNGGCQGMTASDCATSGDRVCDTPPVNAPNSGCPPSTWNTCNETPNLPDDIHNYMDYVSETCMTGFTDGQNDRILAEINLFRANLVSSGNLTYTGVSCTGGLLSDFTASNYSPCINTAITFTAIASPGATYTWDFGDGTTGTGVTTSHTYTSVYQPASVVLTISNGTNSVSSTRMIFVSPCEPINKDQGIWYYGQRGGMNFGSGAPVYDNGSYIHGNYVDEACAVQSTTSNTLLFYTNGINVWDVNHASINTGNLLKSDMSAHRGALIVQNPGNANQYYLFTKDGGYYTSTLSNTVPGNNGFRYSVVQVSGGLASMTSNWNVPIAPPSSLGYMTGNDGAVMGGEGITAVKSCNGYWILTTSKKGTQYYITIFSLTSSGLAYHSETLSPFNTSQQALDVSRNGQKVAIGSGTNGSLETAGLAVFDFNTYTGVLSNQIILNSFLTYGFSFSPDSKLLYSSGWSGSNLYQYDLTDPSPASSGIVVSNSASYACEMQLGPDDKLYLSSGTTYVQVVHQPNVRSTTTNPNACLYTPTGPVMQTTLTHSMPNLIDATGNSVYSNTIGVTRLSCLQYSFSSQLCAASVTWNFGDPASGSANSSTLSNPTHTFSAPGTYTVTVSGGGTTLSTTVQIGTSSTISGSPTICLSSNHTGNYATNLQPGQTASWSVSGGGIAGLNNQPDVMVIWTSLPGTVTLTVTDPATGCSSTSTFVVTESCDSCTSCAVDPSFTYYINNNTCEVTFVAQHGGNPCLQNVTYDWTFDGVPASGSTVTHTFSTAGAHTVCLIVTAALDGQECIKQVCQTVVTNCPSPCDCKLKPTFKYTLDANTCTYYFEGYTGGPSCLQNVEYHWDFGDGTTATGVTPDHMYLAAGNYTVCLTVTVRNSKGDVQCEEKYCEDIDVTCEGKCDCKLDPYFYHWVDESTCTYTFRGYTGGPSCLQNVEYHWNFGDGSTGSGEIVNHMYTAAGYYDVCLTVIVRDSKGDIQCEEKFCETVEVKCAGTCQCKLKPEYKYVVDRKTCIYSFEGASGGPSCLSNVEYYWNFGDGTTDVGQYTNHIFTSTGTFTVCLTVVVYDNKGDVLCEDKYCEDIEVTCKGDCECKLQPYFKLEVDKKECIYTFKGFSGGPNCLQFVEYYWDFGDGTTSMGQNAGHVYAAPGGYEVCLYVIVRNDKGDVVCDEKYCRKIEVECQGRCECKLAPVYTKTKIGSCNYLFTGSSGSPCANIEEIRWYVNGSYEASGQNFTYEFQVNQSYSVCMLVIGYLPTGERCEDTYCEYFFYTDCYPLFAAKSVSDGGTGISSDQHLELYPNPAHDEFRLKFTDALDGAVEVTLKSMDGKVLGNTVYSRLDVTKELTVQLPASLVTGFIMVEVKAENRIYTEKLMVLRN
ncbi:PKD domain-containing protein [Fluviicola sp.]|uniref:PKD domain-containing protein n=1 Tax=Fluviicola sp. TaxID=1917219 RepID=UPI0031DB57D3